MTIRHGLVLCLTLALVWSGCTRVPPRPRMPAADAPLDSMVTQPVLPRDSLRAGGDPFFVASPSDIPSELLPGGAPIVRLGVLAPYSGRYASYGKAYLDGVRLAHEVYAADVELVTADTRGDPLGGLEAARRLIDSDVLAILGGVLNLPTLLASVEANCRAVPVVSNVATEERIGAVGAYVFHQVVSGRQEGEQVADLALLDLRRFRAALVFAESGAGRAMASGFSERWGALGGQLVASEAYAPGTTDFTAIIRRVARARPDVLYLPVEIDEALLIVPALAFRGMQAQLIGTAKWHTDRLLGTVGVDLEGALLPVAQTAADPSEVANAEQLYRERFGGDPNRFAVAGFSAAKRVLDLLQEETAPSRERLRNLLAGRVASSATLAARPRFLVVRRGQVEAF